TERGNTLPGQEHSRRIIDWLRRSLASPMRRAGVSPLQDFSPELMFSGIRRPLREALKVLARHAESISAEWTRSLENLSLHEHQVEALTSLRMSSLRPVLETGQYDNFKLALEEYGRNLEKSGLAADDILCALSSCLASCLP